MKLAVIKINSVILSSYNNHKICNNFSKVFFRKLPKNNNRSSNIYLNPVLPQLELAINHSVNDYSLFWHAHLLYFYAHRRKIKNIVYHDTKNSSFTLITLISCIYCLCFCITSESTHNTVKSAVNTMTCC